MKLTFSDPWRLRRPALLRGVMVDTFRGQMRVRAWPRKRGRAKSAAVREQNEWFKQANKLTRLAPPSQQRTAIEATKLSGLYPRDLLMRSISGGVFDILQPDGQLLKVRRKAVVLAGFQGVRLIQAISQTFSTPGQNPVTWATAVVDTAGMFAPLFPTLLTVPAGINLIEFTMGAQLEVGGFASNFTIERTDGKTIARYAAAAGQAGWATINSGPIDVLPAEQYRCTVNPGAGSRVLTAGNSTYFSATISSIIDT